MKYKKSILIVLICIYFIVFIIISFNKKNMIIIGSYTKISLDNNNISVKYSNDSLDYTSAKIYFNNSFIDGFIETTDHNSMDNFYLIYNSEGVSMKINSSIIAYKGDYNLQVASTTESSTPNSTDLASLNEVKRNNNISGTIKKFKKISFDINTDGNQDNIYSVQLLEGDYITSINYVQINGEIQVLDIIEDDYNSPTIVKESVEYLIDFNEDGNYEICVNKSMGDDTPIYEIIYELQAGEYVEIKEE